MSVTMEKVRTTEEVFQSHREAIEALDIEKLMADYADDAVMVTLDGTIYGKETIQKNFFEAILAQFPDFKVIFNDDKIVFEEDICLLEWTAEASAATIPVGLGILMIEDGYIQRQVEWFQLVPKEG